MKRLIALASVVAVIGCSTAPTAPKDKDTIHVVVTEEPQRGGNDRESAVSPPRVDTII